MKQLFVFMVLALVLASPAQAQLFGSGQDSGVKEQFAVGFPTTLILILVALLIIATLLVFLAGPALIKAWIDHGVSKVIISNKDYTAERVAESAWNVIQDQLGVQTGAVTRQFESANESVKRQFESTNKRLDEIAEQVQRMQEVLIQREAAKKE